MGRENGKRWGFLVVVMVLLMGVLVAKLYDLTITKGESYRKTADSKRIKEVSISAPRGNIYDRNGVLLAGTRSSFAVQGFQDDLSRMETGERNATLRRLIQYIEQDGAEYLTTFPIGMDIFVYATDDDAFSTQESARAYVERNLIANNLVAEWLEKGAKNADGSYRVSVAARALNALSLKGVEVPIAADPENDFALSFVPGATYDAWVQEGKIAEGSSPLQILSQLVAENPNLLSKVLNHPVARRGAYEVLTAHELQGAVTLAPYCYTFQQMQLENKASLHRRFPEVTQNSTAREDFVHIVKEAALQEFLSRVDVDAENHFVVPAKAALEALQAKGVETNLAYDIEKDAKALTLRYAEEEKTLEKPMDRLIRLGNDAGIFDAIIADKTYAPLAEQAMFSKGVYPRISISEWRYGYEIDQADFLKRNELEKVDAAGGFQKMCKVYEIDPTWDEREAFGIMSIAYRLAQQGSLAYVPVNLCYEISAKTVARIEESIPSSSGIVVSSEPIRYYPYGESACHILGYIGNIATNEEIEKYVTNGDYLPGERIGKTGVEESFEDSLHGVSGKRTVLIDAAGNRTATMQTVEPKAGNNLYLSIDINLQIQAEQALKKTLVGLQNGSGYASDWGDLGLRYSPYARSGATISTDPNTGELLCMASYPAYDPNLFVTGISDSDWTSLMPNEEENTNLPRPLLNIATQTAVQPGSSFKPLVGITAMEKGLDPYAPITCSGYMEIGDRRFECLIYTEARATHGTLTLPTAIGHSCNYYFYTLALGMDPRGGSDPTAHVTVEDIQNMAHRFGLDEPTGLEINIPQETIGNVPSAGGKLSLTKAMLQQYLEGNLSKYKKPEVFKNDEDLRADIATIVSWVDNAEAMTRAVVFEKLDQMGYDAENPLPDAYVGLGDKVKYDYLTQAYWSSADALNMIIGQGQNAYTPAEINRYCGAIANGGKKMKLTLLREIRSHDDKSVLFTQAPVSEDVGLSSPETLEVVREGMRLSAQDYYAASVFGNLPIQVGSKTGTAERGGINPETGGAYEDYSWYMAFAPFDDPKIVSVGFVSQGGPSITAIPMVRDTICAYLNIPKP